MPVDYNDPWVDLPDPGNGMIQDDYTTPDFHLDVTGTPTLPSRNPFEDFGSYNDPADDRFPAQQDLGGGFDWQSLIPRGGGSPNGSSGGNRGDGRSPNGNASGAMLAALLPLLMRLFGGGGGKSKEQQLADQQQQAQLQQMNQLLMDKAKRQAPVHSAAMDMALRMAPTGAPNPRMDAALEESRGPRQTTETDPQVMAAIHKLMSGGA